MNKKEQNVRPNCLVTSNTQVQWSSNKKKSKIGTWKQTLIINQEKNHLLSFWSKTFNQSQIRNKVFFFFKIKTMINLIKILLAAKWVYGGHIISFKQSKTKCLLIRPSLKEN